MKKHSSLFKMLVLAVMLCVLSATGIIAITALADEGTNEMIEIKAAFDKSYLVEGTKEWTDNHVGKFQYTVYYDTAKGDTVAGYKGTPVVIYTVNHPNVVKAGTDSNVDIIKSMLDRGYVVIVADYLNTESDSETLARSSQEFRKYVILGDVMSFSGYAGGKEANECFVCPAGCNVLINGVFWEIDKHSTEGTLEKIVNAWNTDLKSYKPNSAVKWATGNTPDTRKKVTDDAVWYSDSECKVEDSENGLYTKLKYTVAEDIYDCVDPDGSFIDMNLYIHIVYPTNPEKPVPVMSLANSSNYPTTATTSADVRPHSNHFLYEGYANAVFDYLWVPMATNSSFGYYDGSAPGITGDHMNYGVHMYNDKLVNTAAMRYLRNFSENEADVSFDLDAFGVYGNSKGGWFSFLGEEIVQSELAKGSYGSVEEREEAINAILSTLGFDRYYDGHYGETRYQVGHLTDMTDPVSGFTIRAAERQPWLTYVSGDSVGKEILSGAQFTYAANGAQEEDITANHSPMFITGNMQDTYNAAYGYSLSIYNICRELDIPLLQFELPIGHTLVSGMDMNYNTDAYKAFIRYLGYFLKDEAIGVAYTSPMDNAGNTDLNTKIKIAFTGVATRSEVERITVTLGGNAVEGIWDSSFGGVIWEFTPTELLSGDSLYTVNIPADFSGENGVDMGEAFSVSFITKPDKVSEISANGGYYTFTAPSEITFGNGYAFRFAVANDAANVAELYAVESTAAVSGELLGSVNLRGRGTYEIDISDYIAKNKGSEVTLLLKAKNAESTKNVLSSDDGKLILTDSNATRKNAIFAEDTVDGKAAVSVTVTGKSIKPSASNPLSVWYDNPTQILTYKNFMGGIKTSVENYGRRFTVGFDIYDTVDRRLTVYLNGMTKKDVYGTIDYNGLRFNVATKANEWVHVEFTYEVYEPDYGVLSDGVTKTMTLALTPTGDSAKKMYIRDLLVTEELTAIDISSAGLAMTDDGSGFEYKEAVSNKPIALYNGATKVGEYATLKEAFAKFVSGYTLKLQANYTLDDTGVYSGIGGFAKVNIDLNGYTITSANKTGALIYDKSASTAATEINISGGKIKLGRTAIVSFADATAENKSFDINLHGVNISFGENSFTTELVCASAIKAGSSVNADIDLTDCVIDLNDAMHAKYGSVIFPAPASDSLKLSYGVKGGEIRLSSQRRVEILNNATVVDFISTNGEYTALMIPESITSGVKGSYRIDNGYASYVKVSDGEDNISTYKLSLTEGSTLYGVIEEAYRDAQAYPFILFSDGVMVGAHTTLKDAVSAANKLQADITRIDSQVEILMTRDFTNPSNTIFGSSVGTILIDLGEHKLTRASNILFMLELNAGANYDYPTNIKVRNGSLLVKGGSLGAIHNMLKTEEKKIFNLDFEDITFGFTADSTMSTANGTFMTVWQNASTNGNTPSETNITCTDCVFDLDANAPTAGGTPFSFGTVPAVVNFRLVGGEIRSCGAYSQLFTVDSLDTATVAENEAGSLTSLKVKAGGSVLTDSYKTDFGEYKNFTLKSENVDGYDVYELTENKNVTDYGVITGGYTDAEAYPFAVFMDGEFKRGYANWSGALGGARGLINTAAAKNKTVTVLLRRNYSLTKAGGDTGCNFNGAYGKIVLDLGNFTITNVDTTFIDVNYVYNANTPAKFTSTLEIINGTLRNERSSGNLFAFGHSGNTEADDTKRLDFIFKGVTFELANGATTVVKEYYDKTGDGLDLHYTFEDCTFDLTNAPSNAVVLNMLENKQKTVSTVVIKGGKMKGNTIISNMLMKYSACDNVILERGANGEYIIFEGATTAVDYAHCTDAFPTAEGNKYFVEISDDGVTSTYKLESVAFGSYGALTVNASNAKYLSAYDYPFFVFYNGSFKSAEKSFKAAVGTASGCIDTAAEASVRNTVEIVMRRDYGAKAGIDNGNNHLFARGTIIVDLQGNILSAVDTTIININLNNSTTTALGFSSELLFKNGEIRNDRETGPMIALGHNSMVPDGAEKKLLKFSFDGVKLSSIAKSIIQDWGHDDKTSSGLAIEVLASNCVFDFTDSASGLTLFHFGTNKVNVNTTIEINGGQIIASNINDYKLYTIGSDDTAEVGQGNDGNYITLIQPISAPTPEILFTNSNGVVLSFGKDKTEGTNTVYLLGEPIKTEYGDIPFAYQSTEDYPFAVFLNGKFVGAYALWSGKDTAGALPKARDAGSVILLRRNFTYSGDYFNNLSYLNTGIVIDLNGFTFTVVHQPMLNAVKKTANNTSITVKNGSIALSGNKPVIDINASSKGAGKFDFIFDNVTIKLLSSAGTLRILSNTTFGTDLPATAIPFNITLNDCEIDISAAKNNVTLFNMSGELAKITAVMRGGKIIGSAASFTLANTAGANADSSLTFTKPEGGNYTTLEIPSASSLNVSAANGGELVFVKISDNGTTATYRLTPKAVVEQSFVPKASITLGSELVFNIYIPKNANLTALTLDGAAVDIGTLIEKDGYHLVVVDLGAKEAARDIILVVTLITDGQAMRGTFTFSIPKYAEKVLADSTASATEKTLVKDVLSYVKAAYAYFGTADAEAMAKIDELLGENYDESSAPVMNGNAEKPTLGITAVTYNLTAKPGLRFYLAEGFKASDFAFSINGSAVAAEEGSDANGKYVEVKLYAYELAETVDYTVNGESDSCHIRCYYEWAKTENNDNLVKLVLRFAKYCESAADYRRAVIGVEN